jgi:SAM-dependent methyltransferase
MESVIPSAQVAWRQVLRRNARKFLEWLRVNEARNRALEKICADLEICIKSNLRDTESCRAFWAAIPQTRSGCNDLTTFSSREAVLAYAYQHLPRRYLRMWDSLTALTARACLPLGREGVRVLDIGTGPGTMAFAINDFYQGLRNFGEEQGIELLARQTTQFSTVESNEHMQRFLSYFREVAERFFPTSGLYADFTTFSPQTERKQYYDNLLREEDFNEIEGEFEPAFTEYEANLEAQGVARFRFVVISYFLTTPEALKQFETALVELVRDLRPGSVVMLLGAPGHEPIHREVESIMHVGHFRRLPEVPEQLDTTGELEAMLKRTQHRIYEHLESVVGRDRLPRDGYPDFWNPEPHPKVQTAFRLTAFRKGRWPGKRQAQSVLSR